MSSSGSSRSSEAEAGQESDSSLSGPVHPIATKASSKTKTPPQAPRPHASLPSSSTQHSGIHVPVLSTWVGSLEPRLSEDSDDAFKDAPWRFLRTSGKSARSSEGESGPQRKKSRGAHSLASSSSYPSQRPAKRKTASSPANSPRPVTKKARMETTLKKVVHSTNSHSPHDQ